MKDRAAWRGAAGAIDTCSTAFALMPKTPAASATILPAWSPWFFQLAGHEARLSCAGRCAGGVKTASGVVSSFRPASARPKRLAVKAATAASRDRGIY
jgi:hypothetical protein